MGIILSSVMALYNGYGAPTTKITAFSTKLAQKNATQKVIFRGKIVFDDIDRKSHRKEPCCKRRVAIYKNGWLFGRTYLGSARTNDLGEFTYTFNKLNTFWGIKHKFTFHLVDQPQPFSARGSLKIQDRVTQIFNLAIPRNVIWAKAEFPAIYAIQSKKLSEVAPPPSTHWQSSRYFITLGKAAILDAPKVLISTLFSKWMSGSQVQRLYDLYGPKTEKKSLTPEFLIDTLINGIGNTGYFINGNGVDFEANFNGYEFDEANSLPNVKVFTKRVKNNRNEEELRLESIAIKYREDSEAEVISVKNKKDLQRGLYIAMSVFGLMGEAKRHLGEGHILPHIAAVPFFKYISRENPIYKVVATFISEVHFINYLGSKGIIFGNKSILDASALSPIGLERLIIDAVKSKADWSVPPNENFLPNDHFSHGVKLHYEMLYDYYSKYINENIASVDAHWQEIYNWSEATHEHLNECPCITERSKNPSAEDRKKLAMFLAWLVTKTTFLHWAVHSRQAPLTDIKSMSLGLRNRSLDSKGRFSPTGNTSGFNAHVQILIARVLINSKLNTFAENAYGDIPQELIDRFNRNATKYTGYPDIMKMMAGTKI